MTTTNEHCLIPQASSSAAERVAIYQGLREAVDEALSLTSDVAHQTPPSDDVAIELHSYADTVRQPRSPITDIVAYCKGQFASYVAAPAHVRHADVSADLRAVRIPVGEYGEENARMLLRGTVRAIRASDSLYPQLRAIAMRGQNAELLRFYTYQGLVLKDPVAALAVTVQQGIVTAAQETAILTAETVPQYQSSLALAAELCDASRMPTLARRIGSRVISTCVEQGRYPSPLLTATEQGLEFSPTLEQFADESRHLSRQQATQARAQLPAVIQLLQQARAGGDHQQAIALQEKYELIRYQASQGLTCPAATRGGGMQKSVQTVLRLAT